MSCEYDEMEIMKWNDIVQAHKNNELDGYFYLYDDGTEAVIEDGYSWSDIVKHYENDGKFGREKENKKMRFHIECKRLKEAAEKAMTLMKKKVPSLERLKIETEGTGKIVITATNKEQIMRLEIPAVVAEQGACFVSKDSMKKVFGLSGMVVVTAADGKFTVGNGKKKSSVPLADCVEEEYITSPKMEEAKLFMEIEEGKLVETLSRLTPFTSKNGVQEMLRSYNLDGKNGWIVALDNFKMALRRMESCFKTHDNVTVPSEICDQMKKIVSSKGSHTVEVYIDKEYILFSGDGYHLWSRLVNGKYFDINRLVPQDFDFSFDVNSNEIGKIAKEYVSFNKGCKKPFMFLAYADGYSELRTGLLLDDYETVDIIESFGANEKEGLDRDFLYTFNPAYIKDAMSLYGDYVMCKGKCMGKGEYFMKTAAYFDDGEYFSLVLPVNMDKNTIEKIKSIMEQIYL